MSGRQKYLLCAVILGGLISTVSWSGVVAFSAGPAWYQAGHTQTIELQSDYANTYHANTSTKDVASWELFVGEQKQFSNIGWGQLGLALSTSSSAQLQGVIWETADPVFDNFNYQYRLFHAHVAMKTKWLFDYWSEQWLPYFSGSLGVAFNNAYQFSMQSLIYEALPVPGFQDNQVSTVTYSLGAGVHKVINNHWQFGMGYEFSDWGYSILARAPNQTRSQGLKLNNFYTQQWMFTLNYLF